MLINYIFDKETKEIRPATDVMEWAENFQDFENRKVARDEVGNFIISTVFLGIDHNYSDGPPILFETMIFDKNKPTEFGGYKDVYIERYAEYQLAKDRHEQIVYKLEGVMGGDMQLEIQRELPSEISYE